MPQAIRGDPDTPRWKLAWAVVERRTTATTRRVPAHRGQVRTSVWNVRLRSSAQGMGRPGRRGRTGLGAAGHGAVSGRRRGGPAAVPPRRRGPCGARAAPQQRGRPSPGWTAGPAHGRGSPGIGRAPLPRRERHPGGRVDGPHAPSPTSCETVWNGSARRGRSPPIVQLAMLRPTGIASIRTASQPRRSPGMTAQASPRNDRPRAGPFSGWGRGGGRWR
jgi:hypothetical protein